MIQVEMPALPGASSYKVASVLVKPGDTVAEGQEIFNVETSKRAVSVRAKAAGTLASILVAEGDEVEPGVLLAEIEERIERKQAGTMATAPASPTALDNATATESSTEHAELLIIGGGTGGYVAALYAAKQGKQVTLVEQDQLGGTCLNRGCIPTKTLVSSGLIRRDIMRSHEWGIEVTGEAQPHMHAIIERKNRVVDDLRQGVEFLMQKNRIRVIAGRARFEGNTTVNVTSSHMQRFSFDDCIIATGSVIRQLNVPGADLPEVMNTDEALDLTELPRSITIVGGGVTGAEFAFMYSNLGVSVTLIARRPRLLHVFDEGASAAILQSAQAHDIDVHLRGDVKAFSRRSDGLIETSFCIGETLHRVTSDCVLIAGGRAPATDELGLENTDISLAPSTRAIAVDEHMRTSLDHIYAVGDVNGLVMLAHAASYQGRIAVDDIRGETDSFKAELIPRVAYTDPEVASVGIGIDEARADAAYTVGTFRFAHNGKALAENEPAGFVAIVANAGGAVKGATVVGAHASELIGYLGLAISSELTGENVRRAVFAHPTTSEAIHEAAFDLTLGALHA